MWILVALLAAPAQTVTLDVAIERALEQAIDVVQAKADMLLVDVERVQALAAVLPSFDLTLTAFEVGQGTPIVEFRGQRSFEGGCVAATGDPIRDAMLGARACPRGQAETTISAFGPYRDIRYANSHSAPQFMLILTANQLLWDGGRWWARIERAEDLRRARAFALEAVENNVRLDVVRAFYTLAKARTAVGTAEQQVGLAAAQWARAKALIAEGKGGPEELATAERNHAQDKLTLAQRRLAESNARRALNLAMGTSPRIRTEIVLPPAVGEAPDSLPDIDLGAADALLDRALAARPELKSARANLDQLARVVDMSAAGHWPAVSLSGLYQRLSRRPDRVFDDPTENYFANLGPTVRWNLFSGRATSASVEQAELQALKAGNAIEHLERIVENDVLSRHEGLAVLVESFALARATARAAEEAMRLAEALYREGRSSGLELRDAELGFTQARLQLTSARLDVEIAREDLRRAVGGPRE